jgi:hypothetical protein
MTVPLHDPSLWPVRMKVAEIAVVLRISRRSLYDRIAQGRFPKSDDGRSWSRDVVKRYAEGGIKDYERSARKTAARQGLAVVSR